MNLTEMKAGVALLLGALVSWLRGIAPVVVLLVLLMMTDYFTGVVAAPYRGEKRNSEKGFRGIVKKFCMLLLVGLGLCLDWLLIYTAGSLDIVLPIKFALGALVTVWLICNEVLSILENIGDIGVALPPFLEPLVRLAQKLTESKATLPDKMGDADAGGVDLSSSEAQ